MVTVLPRFLSTITLMAIFLLLLSFSVSKLGNWDIWWHLRTGEILLQEGTIPTSDFFSYPSKGASWIDLHWGFQVLVSTIYRFLGGAGLVLFKSLLALATLWMVFKTHRPKRFDLLGPGLLFLSVLTLSDRLLVRPEMLSLLFLSITLRILWAYSGSGGNSRGTILGLYALPLIQVLWINIQGIFVLGLFAVWAYALGEGVRFAWPRLAGRTSPLSRKGLIRLFAVAGVCLVACLANPYGLKGLLFPLTLFTRISGQAQIYSTTIGEILSPFDAGPWTLSKISYTILICLSGLSFLVNRLRVHPAHLLLWAGFVYLSIRSNRNMNFFVVTVYPFTLAYLETGLGNLISRFRKAAPPEKRVAPVAPLLSIILLTAVLAMTFLVVTNRLYLFENNHRAFGLGPSHLYPVETVEWIKKYRPQGPMFNHLGLGGYLIYALYPDDPVFIDGRLEVHDASLYRRYDAALRNPGEHFPPLERDYPFGWAILSHSTEGCRDLIRHLYHRPDWQLVALDGAAVVFVQKESNPGPFPEVTLPPWPPSTTGPSISHYAGPFSGLERFLNHPTPWSVMMPFDLLSLGNLFMTLEKPDNAAHMFQRAVEQAPRVAMLHNNLGLAYLQLAKWDKAISAFSKAADLTPGDAMTQSNLGVAYGQKGAIKTAAVYFAKATALDPRYEEAFSNLGAAYWQMARLDDAAAAYSRATELTPRAPEPYYALAAIYARKDDLKRAVMYAEKAKSLGHEGAKKFLQELDTTGQRP